MPAESIVIPGGTTPVVENEYGPTPPEAAIVPVYATPTCPLTSAPVTAMGAHAPRPASVVVVDPAVALEVVNVADLAPVDVGTNVTPMMADVPRRPRSQA